MANKHAAKKVVYAKAQFMTDLVRYRYNTKAAESPDGEWVWRVILEEPDGFKEVLAKRLVVNVHSFSPEDEMPVVGRKYHMACRGFFRMENGTGIIDPS
jgi:hypothetical protein